MTTSVFLFEEKTEENSSVVIRRVVLAADSISVALLSTSNSFFSFFLEWLRAYTEREGHTLAHRISEFEINVSL